MRTERYALRIGNLVTRRLFQIKKRNLNISTTLTKERKKSLVKKLSTPTLLMLKLLKKVAGKQYLTERKLLFTTLADC